ncbi:hypothetical protein [Spirosoma linguale]|uniref:Uncharacterized protein n=1 Tax=Spirosoma linguale (strain ATCC 33905 / DSM 74 / LMG 10896 / Claus 1) TaxID=504472 RepID=D2QF79_SPILD|nr:hypothetical protein Slin_0492 [Spirosoma linguale DSM 74]
MTLVLDIPEQKLQQAEAAAKANGKTLLEALEEYVDALSKQHSASNWQRLSASLPDVPELTEEDIATEIRNARIERRNQTQH